MARSTRHRPVHGGNERHVATTPSTSRTPAAFSPMLASWWRGEPFAVKSPSQFRAKKPPALTSREYAADYAEVKALGALNGSIGRGQTERVFW